MKPVAVVFVALALVGCAASPRVTQSAIGATPSFAAKAHENFSVSGRFAAKRGDEQGSGQFRYTQQGANRTLDLFSPTATQLARIEANARGANVTFADGSVRTASTLSELLRQFIDIPMTDEEFSSWLQALPLVSTERPSIGADGKIESFRESGWTIVVSGRFDIAPGFVRRMRWTFEAGEAAQAAEVRWVFDEFTVQ